jgi:hypothetical protein
LRAEQSTGHKETIKNELHVIGLGNIWQNVGEREIWAARSITKIRCIQAASRNEREEIVITVKGIERLKGQRGVHVLPHYKRKKWHGIIQTGNLETKRRAMAGGTERARCHQSAEEEKESHLLLKCPKRRRCRRVLEQDMAKYQGKNGSQDNTVNVVTEQKNLGTFATRIHVKWWKNPGKEKLKLGVQQSTR